MEGCYLLSHFTTLPLTQLCIFAQWRGWHSWKEQSSWLCLHDRETAQHGPHRPPMFHVGHLGKCWTATKSYWKASWSSWNVEHKKQLWRPVSGCYVAIFPLPPSSLGGGCHKRVYVLGSDEVRALYLQPEVPLQTIKCQGLQHNPAPQQQVSHHHTAIVIWLLWPQCRPGVLWTRDAQELAAFSAYRSNKLLESKKSCFCTGHIDPVLPNAGHPSLLNPHQ